MSSNPLAAPARRAFRAALAALALLAVSAPSLPAADSAFRRPAARPGLADAMLARTALTALDADPTLRETSLVVSVVDRVAVVGGAVPSEEQGRRAEEVVRRVAGIEGVRNRCFVRAGADPLLRAVAERLSPTAPRKPSARDLPGMVRPPQPAAYPEADPDAGAAPRPTAVAAAPAPSSRPPVVSFKIAQGPAPRPSLLLDPVAHEAGPPWAAAPSASTPVPVRRAVAQPLPVARPAGDTLGRLDELRQSEARFSHLTFDLRNGTVVLAGRTPRYADVWEFADAARRVAGVQRVYVGSVNLR